MIKIIYLAMGSELSRKIHSSLHNHTRNSHKPGQSCNVFYGTEMILQIQYIGDGNMRILNGYFDMGTS